MVFTIIVNFNYGFEIFYEKADTGRNALLKLITRLKTSKYCLSDIDSFQVYTKDMCCLGKITIR